MMRILILLTILVSSIAHADSKMGLMGSLLYNTPDIDSDSSSSNIDEEAGLGFGVGMRALLSLKDRLFLRTGAGIVQKSFTLEFPSVTNSSIDASVLYLNIPATLYLKASPQVGIFAGTALNAKLSDDIETKGNISGANADLDAESMVLPAILGFDFMFNEQISLEMSYEYGFMETAEDLKVSSLVTSLIYNFE